MTMSEPCPPYTPDQFELVAETEVDARGRVSLGKAGAEPGRRYRVERNIDGVLLLTPVVSIPEREMIVWRNTAIAESILRGLDEAGAGLTVERPGFTELTDDEDPDED
jgi:hypothetical protein